MRSCRGFTSIKMARRIYEKRIRGKSRRWIHVRPNGSPNGACAEVLTAGASPGNGQVFYPDPTNGTCTTGWLFRFVIVVGSGGGENGEWCWRTRKVGFPSSNYLEKHRAVAACTGANGRL